MIIHDLCESQSELHQNAFPIGGVNLVGGAWTPEAVTFRKFCM